MQGGGVSTLRSSEVRRRQAQEKFGGASAATCNSRFTKATTRGKQMSALTALSSSDRKMVGLLERGSSADSRLLYSALRPAPPPPLYRRSGPVTRDTLGRRSVVVFFFGFFDSIVSQGAFGERVGWVSWNQQRRAGAS